MTDRALIELTEPELTRLVDEAFRNYDSPSRLSASPLAASSLVTPALVFEAPAPGDAGRALQVVLQWAAQQLAPRPPRYPLGQPRPFDDSTWLEANWRRYNLLRHLYLEPLVVESEAGGLKKGGVDQLTELLGLVGRESFFYDERNRALGEAAAFLRAQLSTHQADGELRRMAVEQLLQHSFAGPAAAPSSFRRWLDLAATFRGPFPRAWLGELAEAERLPAAEQEPALRYLMTHRLVGEQHHGAWLSLPPALQAYVYAHRPAGAGAPRWHVRAAQFYREQADYPLAAAWHLGQAEHFAEAARELLAAAPRLREPAAEAALLEMLQAFTPKQLPETRLWSDVQLWLSELWQGQAPETAIQLCRRALTMTTDPLYRGRFLHRLGKLHEDRNPLHALEFYRQALALLQPENPEWVEVNKDLAWIHIHRQEWAEAEKALRAALERAVAATRADVFDALASLYRRQKLYPAAIVQAQQALALRQAMGDWPRAADSGNNLGNIYAEMGEPQAALGFYAEALTAGTPEQVADAHLNIGATLYDLGRYAEALGHYRESLEGYQKIGVPRREVRAYYNLTEALAAVAEWEAAAQHWRAGFARSQQAVTDYVQAFEALRQSLPDLDRQLQQADAAPAPKVSAVRQGYAQQALELARQERNVTTKSLMARTHLSLSPAKEVLAELTRRGLLVKIGQGRATRYVLPDKLKPAAPAPSPTQRRQTLLDAAAQVIDAYLAWEAGQAPPGTDLAALQHKLAQILKRNMPDDS